MNNKKYNNNRNFLIFGHNYIGDTLMLTPAIRALKSKFPESKIIVVVSKSASPVLKRNPDVWKVVEMEKVKGMRGIFGVSNLFLKLRNIELEELGKEKFYACINFLTSFKFAVIGFLLSKKQIGQNKALNNFFFHDKIEFGESLHNIDKSLKFIEPFYIKQKYQDRNCAYEVYEEDIKNARNILKNSFTGYDENDKVVLFSPGSTRKSKEANPETLSLFADYLNGKGYRIIITGSQRDRELSQKILNKIANKHLSADITGLTDIYMLGGLIKLSCLVVSVDNGTMHLASAIKTNLIALFGSTDPAVCGPVSGNSYIIDKKAECYHCFYKDCPKKSFNKNYFPDCMGFIVLDDLIEGAKRLLK
ncbi:MAG: glycosyltransferase family 9 protein [Candidatus Acidulodesulfobacterium ferriphilum]|uniref:Glycosyltransferase family 9 protein n=1 Tax=Candidatus Acidulodesulfobacterium ferriphilum TaxID=2597223 RepID=A0A519BB84_9DELT|nr:MAG: glycosyltransferase family 9 protein [Candidatus Acidulodesulfobacterium ferriphilum]